MGMDLAAFFANVEDTMLARFRQAGFVQNPGDKGENRENILRSFLAEHLPKRYGVTKGEIITKGGAHTHSSDIIIYDALNCPILYVERTAILPIEGVYGIIEIKSRLSKAELVDAITKIERFKQFAPRDLSVIQTREYVTVHRPSRPFGIVLGYELVGNSLDSLWTNWHQENMRIHDVNYFANLVCVLGVGLLHFEKVDLSMGEKTLLLDTDEFVNLVLTAHKRLANKEPTDNILTRPIKENLGNRTFGRFIVYLLIMLGRMKLGTPDLGQYLDPSNIPMMISRES
jgi:hypothetical protein